MLRTLRFAFLVAVAATVAFSAASAIAAPATWQKVDVTLHTEGSGGTILVSGELPATAKLPAQAQLSVPAGSAIQWIGELLGGPASEDPELQYTKSTRGGVDVYQFTLTKSRAAQVEIPTAEALASDGNGYNPTLKWTSAQDVPEVRIGVRVPQNATVTRAAPGATMQPGPEGYSLYARTWNSVKAGDEVALAFSYAAPAAGAATSTATAGGTSTASSSSSWIVPAIIILAAGVAGVALVVSVRQKLAAKGSQAGSQARTGAGRPAGAKTRAANNGSSKASRAATASASEPEPAAEKRSLGGSAKRSLVTAGIIGVLVVTAVVLGSQATKPATAGETITKKFSQAEPCANVVVALALPSDTDSNATANKLFEALAGVKGLNTVTYNGAASNIDVGYCESQTDEAAVRAALSPTGLVAAGAAASTVATAAP